MSKKIGALWKPKKQSEQSPALSGTIELIAGMPMQIAVFKNANKKPDSNQPDYNIVLSQFDDAKKKPIKEIPAGEF